MATRAPKDPSEFAQEHIPMCGKHYLPIDITCEDCNEFICSQCAKTNHKDHDWKTLSTAGNLKRREIKTTLKKVEEEVMKEINEKIKKASKKMEENQKWCDSEVSKIQKHNDAIVSKLDEIKKKLEMELRENMVKKNAVLMEKKIELETKNEQIKVLVKFLEDENSTMSDYSLIDNLRDLTSLVSNNACDLKMEDCLIRYQRGDISDGSLKIMLGQTFEFDDITVTKTNSFQYEHDMIAVMEAINEDTCIVGGLTSGYFEKVNKRNDKIGHLNVVSNDVCVTDNVDMYATDFKNLAIVRLSLSGSVTTACSTAPLTPIGICQSIKGGLLVTLRDEESEPYLLDSRSRRLVRHVTLSCDVIREYEYQDDGRTRLFTVPGRVKQNGNSDICVTNGTSITTGELVILSSSGFLKTVYQGLYQGLKFTPSDVVCDSNCYIMISDCVNSQVHLLSPEGGFMKYLLTENEITRPCSMSLYKSTLWVGNIQGHVTVFQYNNNT